MGHEVKCGLFAIILRVFPFPPAKSHSSVNMCMCVWEWALVTRYLGKDTFAIL